MRSFAVRLEFSPIASHFLIDGPDDAPHTLVLAHGAGAPMDSPFMTTVARGVAARGIRVVRFEFPYMRARREHGRRPPPDAEPVLRASWQSVIEELGGGPGLFIGGKSLGGRIASLIADDVGALGLVCLGYPFHPPGRTDRLRVAHLQRLRTPALIVQGARDPFGGRGEVAAYPLPATVHVVWIDDGDHGFTPRRRSGRTEAQNLGDAVAAVTTFMERVAAAGPAAP